MNGERYRFSTSMLFAVLSAMALGLNYSMADYTPDPSLSVAANACNGFLVQWANAVSGRGYALSCLAIGGCALYYFYRKHGMGKKHFRFSRILVGSFALLHTYGKMYFANNTFSFTFFQIFKFLICFIGAYWLFMVLLHYFAWFMQKDIKRVPLIPKKLKHLFWCHPFMTSFCGMMITWSGHIIVKYPAGFCWDASWQLDQAMGGTTLTAHHPIFHSFLMAWFVRLGRLMGSANVGIFLFVIVQAVILALIFAYGIRLLVEMNTQKWILVFALLFCTSSPFIIGYVGTVIKDVYFTAFCVLYTLLLAEYAFRQEVFEASFWKKCMLVVSCVGMVLFRNNGIFMITPTALALLFWECKKKKRFCWKRVILILATVVIPLGASTVLKRIYQPVPGSIAEALSLPLQQTARFVKYHEDEVTSEEKAAIDKVVDYSVLAENYKPHISDPVKSHFRWGASRSDLIGYFKVWFRQFLREPRCYIDSVLEQNIYLVYPEYSNYAYYIDCNTHHYQYKEGEYFVTPQWLKQWQTVYLKYLSALHASPILQLLNNMAVYVMAFLMLVIFALHRRDYRHLCYMIPLLMSIAVIILAPCILGHPRYTFPIIYTFPFLIGFIRQGKEKEEKING